MKYFWSVLLVAGFLSLPVQPVLGQVFGFKGGLNLSNMVFHPDGSGSSRNYNVHPGFHLGIVTNILISPSVQLESDLLLSTKGINVERTKFNGFDPKKGTVSLLYLDIPVSLKIFLSKAKSKPYLTVGPYVGFGISGKAEYDGKSQDIHFGSAYNEDFKALDFGFTIGGGIQFSQFLIGLNYDIGAINMFSHNDMGGKIYNRNFRVSIGYIFPGTVRMKKDADREPGKTTIYQWWN